MNNKEPTEAQIKEVWEWCGFEFNPDWSEFQPYKCPQGIIQDKGTALDLNNLFKYAEKSLVDYFIKTTSTEEEYRQAYYNFLCKWLQDYIWNEPHNPALSLFWAIYPIIKGGNK